MPRPERSYEVDGSFRVPDLGTVVRRPHQEVTALVWLALATPEGPVTTVALTRSRRYELQDGELVDMRITSATGTARHLRLTGAAHTVSTVEGLLLAAGARRAGHSGQLGGLWHAERSPVVDAIRSGVNRILTHDPLVRKGDLLPTGDTPVHQMRVGCRRLRSDLKTFRAQLHRPWASALRDELGWLAGLLGAARDIEVLRARLAATAGADPLAAIEAASVHRMDALLAARQEAALDELAQAMCGKRYLDLVGRLARAALNPPLKTHEGARAAAPAVPEIAAAPSEHAPDSHWHEWRIEVKRARYAIEAMKGKKDPRARELARLQDLLGEHQDAAIAADTWLSFAADPALAVTAGRLYERERAAVRRARAAIIELPRNSG